MFTSALAQVGDDAALEAAPLAPSGSIQSAVASSTMSSWSVLLLDWVAAWAAAYHKPLVAIAVILVSYVGYTLYAKLTQPKYESVRDNGKF